MIPISKEALRDLLSELMRKRNKINALVKCVSGEAIVAFNPITLRMPAIEIPVHGFYTSISWLYVTYFEAGPVSIKFLSERARAFNLDPDGRLARHHYLVHAFRTFLQHNLNIETREDLAKKERCIEWIQDCLGINGAERNNIWPKTQVQWKVLLSALLNEALQFMQLLESTVKVIKEDESSDLIIKVWISRVTRENSLSDWKLIADQVASDIGLESLNVSSLCRKHVEKWNQRLRALKEDCDFSLEARKLIEQTILNEERLPIPLTGLDIMEQFGIPPGPKVKDLLIDAQKLFFERPCCKEDLLALLAVNHPKVV